MDLQPLMLSVGGASDGERRKARPSNRRTLWWRSLSHGLASLRAVGMMIVVLKSS